MARRRRNWGWRGDWIDPVLQAEDPEGPGFSLVANGWRVLLLEELAREFGTARGFQVRTLGM